MVQRTSLGFVLVLIGLLAGSIAAFAQEVVLEIPPPVQVTVQGVDAIYLAGRDDVVVGALVDEGREFPLVRCGGDLPEGVPAPLPVTPGEQLLFTVAGQVNFYGGLVEEAIGPDGDLMRPAAIEALAGVGGYAGPVGSLVAVFLSDVNPAFADALPPDAAVYFAPEIPADPQSALVAVPFSEFAPALGQVFFIGDGVDNAGTGTAQVFSVPEGATRLFLGTADGSDFAGAPGCYNDNVGAFQVTVTRVGWVPVDPAQAVPEVTPQTDPSECGTCPH